MKIRKRERKRKRHGRNKELRNEKGCKLITGTYRTCNSRNICRKYKHVRVSLSLSPSTLSFFCSGVLSLYLILSLSVSSVSRCVKCAKACPTP